MFEIPGVLIEGDHQNALRGTVEAMCGMQRGRRTQFPGSQPVSFKARDIERLHREDYWVCEKSDGIRILMLIIPIQDSQEVYLIDRKNSYRQLQGMYFPHYANKALPLAHSLLDGELILDKDPATGTETLRLYAFDCMVCDGQNVMNRSLTKRYGRLMVQVLGPFQRMLQEVPQMASQIPFHMVIKKMELAYAVEKVVKEDIPKLHHDSDGLIYTNAENPYLIGTDSSLLKWKSPSENSIDFKLELRFPPKAGTGEVDFQAKPIFKLMACHEPGGGGRREGRYEFFDLMEISNEEWEQMKATGAQFDDRIIEVSWDPGRSTWKFLRFRDDKHDGNHISVVQNIIESISDGVEVDQLLSTAGAVKAAWKARENSRHGQPAPPQQAPRPNTGQNQSQTAPQNRPHSNNPLVYQDKYTYVPPDAKFPPGDIRSSPLYSRVSGPRSVDGILR